MPKAGLALLILLLNAPPAFAVDGRLQFLAKQLEKATDPRARAQAALMLGNAQDDFAKDPLCRALLDDEALVRVSAAKALEALNNPSATECLAPHRNDDDSDVKRAVQKAFAALERLKNQRAILYISMGSVEDRGAKLSTDQLAMVTDRMTQKLKNMGAVFAPSGESKNDAKSVLKQRKLKGFHLIAHVSSLPNNGLKLTVLCFNYPDKALQGEVSVKASGAPMPDLIRALAPRLIEDAAETFEWSDE